MAIPAGAQSCRYLIFAGHAGRTQGGAGDFVGSFSSEDVARRSFEDLFQRFSPDWAHLVRLSGDERLDLLCWRGVSLPGRSPLSVSPEPLRE